MPNEITTLTNSLLDSQKGQAQSGSDYGTEVRARENNTSTQMHMKPNRLASFFGAVALSCLGAVAGEVLRLEPSRSASISTALVSTNGKVLASTVTP